MAPGSARAANSERIYGSRLGLVAPGSARATDSECEYNSPNYNNTTAILSEKNKTLGETFLAGRPVSYKGFPQTGQPVSICREQLLNIGFTYHYRQSKKNALRISLRDRRRAFVKSIQIKITTLIKQLSG